MTKQIKSVKQELAAYREIHLALKEIGSDLPKAQKNTFICRQFKKICGAKEVALFSLNPKTERYEFQTGVGKGTCNYSGGILETDQEPEPAIEQSLKPKKTSDIRIRTLNGVYEFKDKYILTVPIAMAQRTYAIFVCEFEGPTVGANGHAPELFRIFLDYLGLFQAYATDTQILEERKNSLELLYEIGSKLSSTRDENKLLDNILALIERHIQVDRCSLMIMDHDRKLLRIKKAFGINDVDIEKVKVPLGVGIAGYVAMGKRPLLIKDIDSEEHMISQVSKSNNFRTNSLLSVPLVAQGETIGVINVNNRKDGQPFTVDDMELLSKISSEIAAVLQRSYMADQLEKAREIDQTIRKSLM